MEKLAFGNKKTGLFLVAVLSMSLFSATVSGDEQNNSPKIIDDNPPIFSFPKISTYWPKIPSRLIS